MGEAGIDSTGTATSDEHRLSSEANGEAASVGERREKQTRRGFRWEGKSRVSVARQVRLRAHSCFQKHYISELSQQRRMHKLVPLLRAASGSAHSTLVYWPKKPLKDTGRPPQDAETSADFSCLDLKGRNQLKVGENSVC